jgi:hypothetical protein
MVTTTQLGSRVGRVLIFVGTTLFAGSATAATLFDFHWSDGASRSATGSLVLDDSVGVGDPFDKDDVIAFDVELVDGTTSAGTGHFPPFDPDFHALMGTRSASALNVTDLYVSVPFGIRFGCDVGDCLSGRVYFNAATVEFGTIPAARASFEFVEVPEPGAETSIAAALAVLVGMGRRRAGAAIG